MSERESELERENAILRRGLEEMARDRWKPRHDLDWLIGSGISDRAKEIAWNALARVDNPEVCR